jgi:ABC-type multidrug transport system fused ATPase/permease subunit
MIPRARPLEQPGGAAGTALPPSILSYYARNLGRVLRPRRLVALTVAAGMHAAGHAAIALVAGAVALSLVDRGATASALLPGGTSGSSAFSLAFLGLAVLVAKGTAGAYATHVQAQAAGELGNRLRLQVLGGLLAHHRLRHPRHLDHVGESDPSARAVMSLTERVRDLEAGLEQGLLGGARALAQVLPLAALLVALSPRVAGCAVLAMLGFGTLLARMRRAARRGATSELESREQLLRAADEAVRHADVWVSYGAEAKARGHLAQLGSRIAIASARLRARAVAQSSLNEVLGGLALVIATGASQEGWLGAGIDGRTLLAFAFTFFLAYRPVRELTDARLALARAQAAYDVMREAIAGGGEATDRKHAYDLPRAGDAEGASGEASSGRVWSLARLELKGLRLNRGSSGAISARIPPGAVVAIVGPTGAGKTTLVRTLLGLEPAAGGQVLFDGEPLVDAPAGPEHRPFAWVPQDAPLLADTLGANVTLGASRAPGADEEALAALASLGAERLQRELGEARLGAGGRAVSGGERQWIAMARAVATRQPVLLLDEPTSGLDEHAQRRVLEAVARLRGRRTVLLVTHRPEPLALADLVIDLGRSTERQPSATGAPRLATAEPV